MVVDSGYFFFGVVEFVCFPSLSCACEGSLAVCVSGGSVGNVGFLGL